MLETGQNADFVLFSGTRNILRGRCKTCLEKSLFSFDIRHNYLKSHEENARKRETTDTENAWGVQLNTSKETKKNKSVTIFYLGIKTTKGQYNDYDSDKHKVHVGQGMRYYTAYEKAGRVRCRQHLT